MTKIFLVYDGRACGGIGTDNATVMVVCESLKEARNCQEDYGQCAIYEYEDRNGTLVNEQWVEDLK